MRVHQLRGHDYAREEARRILANLKGAVKQKEVSGVTVIHEEEDEIRLSVGPATVFFRIVHGLESCFVQRGHYVLPPEVTAPVPVVDGEWDAGRSFISEELKTTLGGSIVLNAVESIVAAVVDWHGQEVRFSKGAVAIPWEQDKSGKSE